MKPFAVFERQPPGRSPAAISAWFFLRLLGVVYAVAFVSLGKQILGLVGSHGIVPAASLLDAAHRQFGPERYWLLPTLSWWSASDRSLQWLCGAGAWASVLLLLDVAPALMAAAVWVLYLSLVTVCREFLWFQWDSLLLEAGFLAIFLSPLRLLPQPGRDPLPSHSVTWLLRWLLLRLMVSSGAVKWLSGDAAWRHLTALQYHYETQPLPTWIGWYAHQLPGWWQALSAYGMFLIELGVPFLIFWPGRPRRMACGVLVVFQGLILATGNYGFFNLLAIALCVLLLDDRSWPAWWQAWWTRRQAQAHRLRRWPAWIIGPVTALVLLLTTVPVAGLWGVRGSLLGPLARLYGWAEPFRVVNSYGLFAVMTTSRPEIILEGSRDGQTWLAYEFKDKPGELTRPPRFVAPHQPRLDWQMWFAALGTYERNRWFIAFCERVLRGTPEVLSLLSQNPFPDSPPRYLRATVYDYRFTDVATRRATGAWWRRTERGLYCPVMSLSE